MIKIKKSTTADSRTCNYLEVTKKQLLRSSKQHINDVRKGMKFLMAMMNIMAKKHDYTKLTEINSFYKDFLTDFSNKEDNWFIMHIDKERHHIDHPKYNKEDVNLLDVLEYIVDTIMADLGRKGVYEIRELSNEILQKAYKNTIKLLLDNTKIVDKI